MMLSSHAFTQAKIWQPLMVPSFVPQKTASPTLSLSVLFLIHMLHSPSPFCWSSNTWTLFLPQGHNIALSLFFSSSCRLPLKCHLLWEAFPDHPYMSYPLLPLSYTPHQALFFFITCIAIWDDVMLCCLSLPSEQNGQEIRISTSPSPYSLYLVKCLAYSRHSIIIWGRNAYIMHVKTHGKVQSCTVDRKITHQLCLPTLMKRGFTRRFGNFL